MPDLLALVRAELARIAADSAGAGELESIGVNDEGEGWASLGATSARHDFYWYGRVERMLVELRSLPDLGGPTAIREHFRSD